MSRSVTFYAMANIFLSILDATAGAFISVERFIDTVFLGNKLANIRHFRVTLLAIEHLCKFAKRNVFSTVKEMRLGRDCLTMVYSPIPIRTQNAMYAHAL